MKHPEFTELYTKLLSEEFKGKPIWQRIAENELTATPHFVGDGYKDSKVKLMVVGRAVNGWKIDTKACVDLKSTVELIMNQRVPFADFVNQNGIPDEENPLKRPYRYKTSKFWKLAKFVLEQYGESDVGEWYHDSQQWSEKVIWSNLYKVAPREAGNPGSRLIDAQIRDSVDIIQKEMDIYQPEHVLFITDLGYFTSWGHSPSFAEIMQNYRTEKKGCVVATASYNGAKIVVCTRPDRRGISDANIAEMAQEIKVTFGEG